MPTVASSFVEHRGLRVKDAPLVGEDAGLRLESRPMSELIAIETTHTSLCPGMRMRTSTPRSLRARERGEEDGAGQEIGVGDVDACLAARMRGEGKRGGCRGARPWWLASTTTRPDAFATRRPASRGTLAPVPSPRLEEERAQVLGGGPRTSMASSRQSSPPSSRGSHGSPMFIPPVKPSPPSTTRIFRWSRKLIRFEAKALAKGETGPNS